MTAAVIQQAHTVTQVPGQTAIQRAAEVRKLVTYTAPQRIVIDPGLRPGQWYVVRGLTLDERAVVDSLADAGGAR
jgi:hypothetical protein